MPDFRNYSGTTFVVANDGFEHRGVAHDENPPGRGSGRYAFGTGKQGGRRGREKAIRLAKERAAVIAKKKKKSTNSLKSRIEQKKKEKAIKKAHEERIAEQKRQAAIRTEEEKKKAEEKRLQEEFQREKENILKNGTADDLLKFYDKLSNTEVDAAIKRIDNRNKLKNMSEKDKKKALDVVDSVMKDVGKVQSWGETLLKAADTAGKFEKLFKERMESNQS